MKRTPPWMDIFFGCLLVGLLIAAFYFFLHFPAPVEPRGVDDELLGMDPISVYIDNNVTVVCCGYCQDPIPTLPTCEVDTLTPTKTPWTLAPTWTPTRRDTNTPTVGPSSTPTIPRTSTTVWTPTITRTLQFSPTPTSTPLPSWTPVPSRTPTSTVATKTRTPTATQTKSVEPSNTPTFTASPSPTDSPTATDAPTNTPTPTREPCICYQWVCHKLGSGNGIAIDWGIGPTCGEGRWKNYCCWSNGCINAHIGHGDLLGRCEDHGITPDEPDEWNKEGCP